MKQTLLLIRHGQTTWNVEHRLPGQLAGVELNDNGRQQVIRLAEALSALPISAVITSPLERACETAKVIAQRRDLPVHLEADLMDTNVGKWAGQVIEELVRNDPAWRAYVSNPTEAPEGIETFPQVQQRVVAAVERWRKQEQSGAYPAFVAHSDVVKLLLAHYSGLEAKHAGSLFIANASVSLVELETDAKVPHILAIGWSPSPDWLKAPIPDILKGKSESQEQGKQKM
jgi:probable phosphoglycerate mutase